MSEDSSAKFFVKADGSSVMKRRGDLSRKEQVGIQRYIKKHYMSMYAKWARMSKQGFFVGK
jgi:hypothetical protein